MIGEVQAFVSIYFAGQGPGEGLNAATGGMNRVILSFPSTDFYKMKAAFVGRYGEPTTRQKPTVQNRMGAQFENEKLAWDGERVVIRLDKYGSTLDKGFALIETVEGRRACLERLKDKAKSGEKDL
jgi:hypothetical protein